MERSDPPSGLARPPQGPWEQAIRIVIQRGIDLRDRGLLLEAQDCFRHCLELGEGVQAPASHATAQGCLGSVAMLQGDTAAARSWFEQALALRREAGDPLGEARSLNDLAICDLRGGKAAESLQKLAKSLSLTATDCDGRIRAEALESMGRVHLERGELQDALRFFKDCLAIHEAKGDLTRVAGSLDSIGKVHHRMSAAEEAFAAFRKAYEIRRGLPDQRARAATANNLATEHYAQGEFDEAEALLSEALTGFLAVGHKAGVAHAHSNLGLVCADQGRMEEGSEHHRRALVIREELQDLLGQANSWNNLSHVALERGDPWEGLRCSARAEELRRRAGGGSILAKPLYNKGRACTDLDRLDEAGRLAKEVIALSQASGAIECLAEGHILLAETLLRRGVLEEARAQADEAHRLATRTKDARLISSALRLRGKEMALRGEHTPARELLARAERYLKGKMYGAELPRVHREQGGLAARVGSHQSAVERLGRAVREFAQIGNRLEEARTLALLAHSEGALGIPEAARTRARAEEIASSFLASGVRVDLELPEDRRMRDPWPAASPIDTALELMESLRSVESIAGIGPWLGRLRGALGADAVGLLAALPETPAPGTALLELTDGAILWTPSDQDRGRSLDLIGGSAFRQPIPGTGESCALLLDGIAAEAGSPVLRLLALHLGRGGVRGIAPRPADAQRTDGAWEGLVGLSPTMEALFRTIERVARSDVSVLILGESGTGKELVARAIHARSARASGPFVAVNCPSIPRELIEAEMFGHEKGSFTGATQARPGRVEMADGGTLFLDEVADMDIPVQSKLLRFLQEREMQRVGGRETIRVDVRVVAATSRDLEHAMELGTFRPDLYFRLNVVPIRIPPLRERVADVPVLAHKFLGDIESQTGRKLTLTSRALDRLGRHSWPGNVRELKNTVTRMAALAEEDLLDLKHIPSTIGKEAGQHATNSEPGLRGGETLSDRLLQVEAGLFRWALTEEGWNQSAAARRLGVSETMVRNRMRQLGIAKPGGGSRPDR